MHWEVWHQERKLHGQTRLQVMDSKLADQAAQFLSQEVAAWIRQKNVQNPYALKSHLLDTTRDFSLITWSGDAEMGACSEIHQKDGKQLFIWSQFDKQEVSHLRLIGNSSQGVSQAMLVYVDRRQDGSSWMAEAL